MYCRPPRCDLASEIGKGLKSLKWILWHGNVFPAPRTIEDLEFQLDAGGGEETTLDRPDWPRRCASSTPTSGPTPTGGPIFSYIGPLVSIIATDACSTDAMPLIRRACPLTP